MTIAAKNARFFKRLGCPHEIAKHGHNQVQIKVCGEWFQLQTWNLFEFEIMSDEWNTKKWTGLWYDGKGNYISSLTCRKIARVVERARSSQVDSQKRHKERR